MPGAKGVRAGLLLVALVLSATAALSQSPAQAEYVVKVFDPASREALVEARFSPRNGRLTMGRSGAAQHLEEGFATFVHDLVVADDAGSRLEVEDLRRANWRVQADGEVRLQYRVELTHDQMSWPFGYDEASYAFDRGFFFVGESLFVFTPGLQEIDVRFELPEGWRVTTPWREAAGGGLDFRVRNVEELSKSCFVVGTHLLQTIRAGGTEVDLAFGQDMAATAQPLESALRLLLDAYTELFGGGRSERFLIVLNRAPYDGAGAYPSSISILTKDAGAEDRVAPPLLYMVAHEVLHLWNGRQLVPAGQAEWFKEGITDYLTLMTLRRVGLESKDWLYQALADHLRKYRGAAGSTSIAKAGARKADNYDLVYSGGAVVGWALDLQLRAAKASGSSLDRFLRDLFHAFAGEAGGFDRGDLIAALERGSGHDFGGFFERFFERFVDGTEPLEIGPILALVGLELSPEPDSDQAKVRLAEISSASEEQLALRDTWLEGR